jgi:hypothetical protein
VAFASLASAADHRDSPTPVGNPGADLTDVFIFRSPTTPDNAVLVVNTHGFIAPIDNATASFDSNPRFQVHVDNDGDLVDDVQIDIRKSGDSIVVEGIGNAFSVNATPAGAEPIIREDGGRRLFAGLRDDPFFFDIPGFHARRRSTASGPRAGAIPSTHSAVPTYSRSFWRSLSFRSRAGATRIVARSACGCQRQPAAVSARTGWRRRSSTQA